MQIIIFLIEVHWNLRHSGPLALIFNHFCNLIHSDWHVLHIFDNINWTCSEMRCVGQCRCNCICPAPHDCKWQIPKKHVVATICDVLFLFKEQLIRHLPVRLGDAAIHSEGQTTQDTQRTTLWPTHARRLLCIHVLHAGIFHGGLLSLCFFLFQSLYSCHVFNTTSKH